jgi:hypothetical protein
MCYYLVKSMPIQPHVGAPGDITSLSVFRQQLDKHSAIAFQFIIISGQVKSSEPLAPHQLSEPKPCLTDESEKSSQLFSVKLCRSKSVF